MATEAAPPVNGSYGDASHTSPQTGSLSNGGADQSASSPPKDEVGWYFVEQYYTTMSRTPEKVHLFYNKRSQFVYGVEAEKVPVSVGQRAISERISELGIEDCKVRVTNVDSQESGKSIVLQVVGEMSVKGQPHRKFVQTFVLAEQPNGYFVLNDIFRYVADEPEDEEFAAEPEAESEPAPVEIKTLTSSDDLVEQAKDAEIVDQKLEQASAAPTPAVEMAAIPDISSTAPEPAPAAAADAEPAVDDQVPEADAIKPEVPKDPTPSPVATPAPAAAPAKETAAPSKPAAPKTWASMLAGSKAPVPIVPNVPIPSVQSQSKSTATPAATAANAAPAAAAAAAAAAATPAAPAAAATPTAPAAPASTTSAQAAAAPAADVAEVPASPGGWQTAGQDNTKKQNRTQTAGNVSGYIKNVTANIDGNALKAALSQVAELDYFDVSRQKNCAFVEFKTPAGFKAAVAASPYKVNGEDIYVEERRRTGAYGNNFRGGIRGNRNSIDGRAPSHGGRGGFRGDSYGGFVPRGRGGGARGRGGTGQDA